MSIDRLLEEIVHIGRLSPPDELELLGDVMLLLSNANEVKDRWERIKTMSSIHFCTAIISSGERKGDMCGKLLKSRDLTYCLAHANYTPPKEPTQENSGSSTRDNILICQNRFNNFLFPGTSLILDDKNRVVAKEGEQGEWLPLEDEDIRQAKTLRLRYKIKDKHFKGEQYPQSIADYMSKAPEEKQSIADAFYPRDLFVARPLTNPDETYVPED